MHRVAGPATHISPEFGVSYALTMDDVLDAAKRIADVCHRTPVLTCTTLDELTGRKLFFKCENLQRVGAFKFRGALNAVRRLPSDIAENGVVTHSSGNHAQALALAARIRGIPAHIVMPVSAPTIKQRAVAGYGGLITQCPATLEARESTANRVRSETGATLIHPYDNADIIAGAGTAALELLEEVPDLDAIIAPIGGGGLMSGTCIATRARSSHTRLFAAEPAGADDAARSFASGHLIPQTDPRTIADGLLTSLGQLTWPIVRDHLEEVLVVDDDAILSALRLVWERMKLIIEPSSAVPLAAVLAPEFRARPHMKRVGIILSGGNAALDVLCPGICPETKRGL